MAAGLTGSVLFPAATSIGAGSDTCASEVGVSFLLARWVSFVMFKLKRLLGPVVEGLDRGFPTLGFDCWLPLREELSLLATFKNALPFSSDGVPGAESLFGPVGMLLLPLVWSKVLLFRLDSLPFSVRPLDVSSATFASKLVRSDAGSQSTTSNEERLTPMGSDLT